MLFVIYRLKLFLLSTICNNVHVRAVHVRQNVFLDVAKGTNIGKMIAGVRWQKFVSGSSLAEVCEREFSGGSLF